MKFLLVGLVFLAGGVFGGITIGHSLDKTGNQSATLVCESAGVVSFTEGRGFSGSINERIQTLAQQNDILKVSSVFQKMRFIGNEKDTMHLCVSVLYRKR